MSATFLVTGFEPFGEHLTNSSWDALELARAEWPEAIAIRRLPVDYYAAHGELRRAIEQLQPRAVLCIGLARGDGFRIERRARRPAALADVPGASESWGRWPWAELRGALDEVGVRSVDSEDAGQYVCESTYWSLLNYENLGSEPEFAAFLHVPPESERYPLDLIAQAVGLAITRRHAALTRGDVLSEEIR